MRHSTASNAVFRSYGNPLLTWKEDLLASVVVFLVALPLSMGIAIASGIPIEKMETLRYVFQRHSWNSSARHSPDT